ncbi:MAG: hypothetical protein LBJ23_03585 [Tannerella sp.]|jgi:hypothetical protein|nr:hypothetical protein [Tannerella sp.]
MSTRDFIPRKDVDFYQWVNNFYIVLIPNITRFGIPQAACDTLIALKKVWDDKYSVAEAPSTRTKSSIHVKTQARATLESALRIFIREYLTYSSKVTDIDRDNLGLPIHKTTRTPSQIPKTPPQFKIDSSIIRRLKLHFFDNNSRRYGKPSGVHSVEIIWAILDAPPVSIDKLIHSSSDTRSPFMLEFSESNRGKSVYFCLRWENMRGEKGPWGEIIMAIIP